MTQFVKDSTKVGLQKNVYLAESEVMTMKLYPHQIDGLQKSADMNHVAYFWDMGL